MKTPSAHDNPQREGRETRRRDMLFSPFSNRVTFLMGFGRGGGGHFTQTLAFLLALTDKNDNNKVPHSPPVEKSGYTHGLKSSFFKNFQAVNH